MIRPSHLLFALLALSLVIGAWFVKQQPTSPAPVVQPTSSVPPTPVPNEALDTAKKRVDELSAEVTELRAQLKSLREENSGLIDKLASLGLQSNGKPGMIPVAPDTDADSPPDFVGMTVELMTLHEIQEPPPPTIVATLPEVEKLILNHLRKSFPGDYGSREGEAFAALGLIPESLDTIPLRAALLARLVGAWYDEGEGAVRIADPRNSTEEAPVLTDPALGLSYAALLRQYAKVALPMDGKPVSTDERMARMGLLGGDAALLRFLRELKKVQQPNPNELPADDPDHPLNQVPMPAFMRELELFPQVQGFHFAQALHSVGGFKQINAAYGNMPKATADVIDTERYLNQDRLPVPHIQWDSTTVNKAKPIWDDRLGQAAVFTMLKRFNLPEAAAVAAKGWQSDRFLAYHAEGSLDGRGHAVWQSRWTSPEAADRFFEAMREWLARFYEASIDKIGSGPLVARTRSIDLVRLADKHSILLIDAADAIFAASARKLFVSP